MARLSELTQAIVDDAAEKLQAQGKRPSPNAVRAIVNTGSFSTIKKMLDTWDEKQQQEEKIPVPEIPEFAHRFIAKLHRELYLQNHSELEQDRQALEASRQAFEIERAEMLAEISALESKSSDLTQRCENQQQESNLVREKLESAQHSVEEQSKTISQQQVTLATLTEREKQLQVQIKDKDSLLDQARKIEASLQEKLQTANKKR